MDVVDPVLGGDSLGVICQSLGDFFLRVELQG